MGYVMKILGKLLGVGLAMKVIYIAMAGVYVSALLATFAGFVVGFFYFFDLVQSLLTQISGNGYTSDAIISKMFGILNCIGFTSALNDSKSLLIGGALWVLGRLVYVNVTDVFKSFLQVYYSLMPK